MAADRKFEKVPTRAVKPVRFTITVEANAVNQNGTFSKFNILDVQGPNTTCKVNTMPNGSLWLKTAIFENITVLAEGEQHSAKDSAFKLWS